MEKTREFIKKNCYVLVFLLILVLLLPSTIARPSQSDNETIALAMGIDKEEEKIKVSVQVLTPQSTISNNKSLQVISEEGSTVLEALNNLHIKIGSRIGFDHVSIVMLNEEASKDNVINYLDYLFRNTKINYNALLCVAEESSEDLLNSSAEINNDSSGSLQNNFGFNLSYFGTNKVTTIGNFFNDYYSFSSTSFVPYLMKKEDKASGGNSGSGGGSSGSESSGEDSSSGGGSGSGGSSPESSQQDIVNNDGHTALFKNGKFYAVLSNSETRGFDWLDNISNRGIIKVTGVTDDKYYQDATVTMQVEKFKYNMRPVVENNKLIYKVNIEMYGYVSEIIQDSRDLKLMQSYAEYLTPTLKEKYQEKVKEDVQNVLNYCKDNNIDSLNFYNTFYKFHKNELKKILRIYGTDYLKACEIDTTVSIEVFK